MINRILIRIKVVQLLYSYILTEKDFELEDMPLQLTREKRFAYKGYLDTLYIIKEISERLHVRGSGYPLKDTRLARVLSDNEKLRPLKVQYSGGEEAGPMNVLINNLVDSIKDSGLYKNLSRKKDATNADDVKFWREVFEQIIYPAPVFKRILEEREGYSLRGMEQMRELTDNTFTSFLTAQNRHDDGVKALKRSLDKARELYFMLLLLPVELCNLREREIEDAANKFLPSAEDLNPNMRFVENALVEKIRDNEIINNYVDKNSLSWIATDRSLLEGLLKEITESDIYKDYMDASSTDMHRDTEFWRQVYKKIIFHNTDFLESLEDKSIFWNDDVDIIGTFLLKTLKRFEENEEDPILPMYKDEEDARFGEELFRSMLDNREEYHRLIEDFIRKESWDINRMAFMDIVIIETALAEIMNFPKIPVKVSINEYVEIAKGYSTNKSGSFVNGILASIITKLREEHRLLKE